MWFCSVYLISSQVVFIIANHLKCNSITFLCAYVRCRTESVMPAYMIFVPKPQPMGPTTLISHTFCVREFPSFGIWDLLYCSHLMTAYQYQNIQKTYCIVVDTFSEVACGAVTTYSLVRYLCSCCRNACSFSYITAPLANLIVWWNIKDG